MLPIQPKLSFRAITFIFGLLFIGLAIFVHGWVGWSEDSVLIQPKNAASYLASPNSATAFSFYVYTLGLMIFGAVTSLAGLLFAWIILFSSSPRRSKLIGALNQPIKGRNSSIPMWLFWCIISTFVCVCIYAAINNT